MDIFVSELNFWHWLILAVLMLVMELASGSGFLLWVAIGSALTSMFAYLLPSLDWPWQLVLFSTFSVVACVIWWRYLKRCTEMSDKPKLNQRTEHFIGRTFKLESAIENGRGKVKIGDTYWLVEGADLAAGAKVKVESVDGVLLHVVAVTDEKS